MWRSLCPHLSMTRCADWGTRAALNWCQSNIVMCECEPECIKVSASPLNLQERVLFIADWWHTTGAAIAMQLNRPFDANRTTNTSGAWAWANNPQASSWRA